MMQQVQTEMVPGKPYQYKVTARGHEIVGDAPLSSRGGDTGMTPSEWFLAALGTCAGMTVQMAADARKWKLDKVRVIVTEDSVDHPDQPGVTIPRITHLIEIEAAGLTQAQLDRLKSAGESCKVKKKVSGKILFETKLAYSDPASAAGNKNAASPAAPDGEAKRQAIEPPSAAKSSGVKGTAKDAPARSDSDPSAATKGTVSGDSPSERNGGADTAGASKDAADEPSST